MEECVACLSKYTDKRRVKLTCPECKFECCKECVSRNIKANGFHCAGCKKIYCPIFIGNNFSNSYIKKHYMLYMKNSIIGAECKLFPETKKKMLIEGKKAEMAKLMDKAILSIGENVRPLFENKILNLSANCFKDCFYPDCDGIMYKDEDEKYFTCDKCKNMGCPLCEDICNENHKCDKEKIETLEMIKKDTTPCPNCGERIFKADGCSQIMCSKCKTFFDFNTGKEENANEPRHAMDYHLLSDNFEKKIVGVERFDKYVKDIKICRDWELWNPDNAKNKYFKIIHDNEKVKAICASIINYKVYLRRMLMNYMDSRSFNENCRKSRIAGVITVEEFNRLSLINYFHAYNRMYVLKKLSMYFFSIQEELHKYIGKYDNTPNIITSINKSEEKLFIKNIGKIAKEFGDRIEGFGSCSVDIKKFNYTSIV